MDWRHRAWIGGIGMDWRHRHGRRAARPSSGLFLRSFSPFFDGFSVAVGFRVESEWMGSEWMKSEWMVSERMESERMESDEKR